MWKQFTGDDDDDDDNDDLALGNDVLSCFCDKLNPTERQDGCIIRN